MASQGSWSFGFLIPHVGFVDPIEYGPLALVPHNDPRLVTLAQASNGVNRLLTRFTDQFGESIEPSALLIASDGSATVDYYAVTSFRNCIAITSIIDGWVRQMTGGNAGYPLWSDYFDFYPFTIDSGGDLSARSLASNEINRPDDFRGQKTPYLPLLRAKACGVDREILSRLWTRWERFLANNIQERRTRILFRSLEVAYQAMRVPASGSRYPTIHELGVGVGLWVSAFEILAHPWRRNANLGIVLDLLGGATWSGAEIAATRYQVEYPRNNVRRVNYVQKLYSELYAARNDYLHGNDVTPRNLFPARRANGPTLLHSAPLIYRAALDAHLPELRGTSGRSADTKLQEAVTALFDRGHYEDALLACRNPQQ